MCEDCPAPNPLTFPLGGHALADLLLERAMRQHYQAQVEAQAEPPPARQPTGKEIVRAYYVARRRDRKLTLSKYLRSIGAGHREGYIRKVKVAYDRGKRH